MDFLSSPDSHCSLALISSHSHCFIGKTDLSKYYPSLPLHAEYQRYVYIRDPRLDTQWRGVGPPSAEWLAHRAARAGKPRIGPYRRHTGLPLGLSLAPAFASALSGEMVQFLSSLGVSATMYVDDLLCWIIRWKHPLVSLRHCCLDMHWRAYRRNPKQNF